jgi:hypothetical protein
MGAVGAGWGWGEGGVGVGGGTERGGGRTGANGARRSQGTRQPQTADGQHMRECPQKNTEAGYDRAAIAIGKQQQQDTRRRRTYKET